MAIVWDHLRPSVPKCMGPCLLECMGPSAPECMGPCVPKCMGPSVPSIMDLFSFTIMSVVYRDLLCPGFNMLMNVDQFACFILHSLDS